MVGETQNTACLMALTVTGQLFSFQVQYIVKVKSVLYILILFLFLLALQERVIKEALMLSFSNVLTGGHYFIC